MGVLGWDLGEGLWELVDVVQVVPARDVVGWQGGVSVVAAGDVVGTEVPPYEVVRGDMRVLLGQIPANLLHQLVVVRHLDYSGPLVVVALVAVTVARIVTNVKVEAAVEGGRANRLGLGLLGKRVLSARATPADWTEVATSETATVTKPTAVATVTRAGYGGIVVFLLFLLLLGLGRSRTRLTHPLRTLGNTLARACDAFVHPSGVKGVSEGGVESVGVVVCIPEKPEVVGEFLDVLDSELFLGLPPTRMDESGVLENAAVELCLGDVPERAVQECLHGLKGLPEQVLAGITCVVAVGKVRVHPVVLEGSVKLWEGDEELLQDCIWGRGCLGEGRGRGCRSSGGRRSGERWSEKKGRLPIKGGVAGTRLAEVLPPAVPLLRLLSRLMGTKGRERCLAPY